MPTNIILVIVIVSGLALGSFVNAYVWRVRKQSEVVSKNDKTRKLDSKKYSILSGRSICPECGHRLASLDLIPILSWLGLRGRCRYCKTKISISYPLIEVITLILFLVSYVFWPEAFRGLGLLDFIFWLFYLVNLVALALYDIKWLLLPNRMLYPVFGAVLVQILATVLFFNGNLHYLLASFYGFIVGGGIFYILFQVSGGKWIGGGDVRLGAVLGLMLGSGIYAAMMIFLSSLIGTFISVPLLLSGKLDRKAVVPYGPYLIIAAMVIRLFGSSLISWLRTKGVYV